MNTVKVSDLAAASTAIGSSIWPVRTRWATTRAFGSLRTMTRRPPRGTTSPKAIRTATKPPPTKSPIISAWGTSCRRPSTVKTKVKSAASSISCRVKAWESKTPFGKEGGRQFPLAAAFDALTLNTDRHMGNWLVDPKSGQMTLIDHGLSFPDTHEKPLVGTSEILGKAARSGTPVPKEAIQWMEQWPHIQRAMSRNGLTPEQIATTQKRLASLADAAANGETFWQWRKRSGLDRKYYLA